ncbi:MAG: preprotein translocase subunit TatA [Gammaproteobacteria bacterium]|nr:preprotein translocase subunit TatA [Gammaproteobacteria bacterium]
MFIRQKYDYPILESVTYDDGRRHYLEPENGNKLPSVTTILSAMTDKSAIEAWKQRIGEEEAHRQVKHATDVGTIMHGYVEDHIAGKPRVEKSNFIYKQARKMADTIIGRGLTKVNEVYGYEVKLFYPSLYAGTTDLVGEFNGTPAIMDHKNAKKIKKREWIESYFFQLVAYAMAHNHMFNTDIQFGVIFMASRDDDYKEFYLEGREFEEYTDRWLEMVQKFYNQAGQ